jgi:hypothetical protein
MVSLFCFVSRMFSIFLKNEKFGNYWQGFPEPNSTAAGSRMLQLMDLF